MWSSWTGDGTRVSCIGRWILYDWATREAPRTFLEHSSLNSVQSLSRVRLFAAPRTAARHASLSITNSWSLLRLMSIESMMPSNYLILCCLLFLLFPSIRVVSNESVFRIRWPKYWSFSFSISLFNEYSGLISFRLTRVLTSPNWILSRESTWAPPLKGFLLDPGPAFAALKPGPAWRPTTWSPTLSCMCRE